MARPLDERQRHELAEFANAIAAAAGYTSTAEWARDAGYDRSALSELRNGVAGVDGYNLLKLLRAAAARTTLTPEALAAGLAQATAVDGAAASIDRRLEELSDLVTEALTLLHDAAPQRTRGAARTGRAKRAAS